MYIVISSHILYLLRSLSNLFMLGKRDFFQLNKTSDTAFVEYLHDCYCYTFLPFECVYVCMRACIEKLLLFIKFIIYKCLEEGVDVVVDFYLLWDFTVVFLFYFICLYLVCIDYYLYKLKLHSLSCHKTKKIRDKNRIYN